jgi:hypothetical protein
MKKTLLILAVAFGALAAAGIAWSSGVLGGGPAQIRVYGGGQVATPTPIPRTISIEANASMWVPRIPFSLFPGLARPLLGSRARAYQIAPNLTRLRGPCACGELESRVEAEEGRACCGANAGRVRPSTGRQAPSARTR